MGAIDVICGSEGHLARSHVHCQYRAVSFTLIIGEFAEIARDQRTPRPVRSILDALPLVGTEAQVHRAVGLRLLDGGVVVVEQVIVRRC